MDVNLSAEEMNECVDLIPVGIYTQKVNLKKKIYSITKRGIDIIGGVVGIVCLIPLTIRCFYSTNNL